MFVYFPLGREAPQDIIISRNYVGDLSYSVAWKVSVSFSYREYFFIFFWISFPNRISIEYKCFEGWLRDLRWITS